jgi:CubicO group peptidase (beta-lactamase class C family)
MTRKRLALVIVAIGAMSVAPRGASDPLPRATPASLALGEDALAASSDVLKRAVDAQQIAGGVAMLARNGRLAYLATVGVQDLDTRVPYSERTLARIYSMTRPITAVAVMMLVEQRKFSLDDPVSRYIPEFASMVVQTADGGTRPPVRPISIRDLLLHTSGLDYRTSDRYRDAHVRSRSVALPQFIQGIVRLPLLEDPGTRYRYSEATTVLGRLVEVTSGEPFERFLEARVFKPLGMVDTGFWATPEQRPRLATVYGPGDDGSLRPVETETVPFTERPALIEGAVGLLSTAADFLRFSQMLLNRGELDGVRLLKAETVDTMVVNGLSESVLAARGRGVMGWGLGNVNVVIKPEELRYPANRGEYGWDGTAGTIFWNDPLNRTIILLFTQSSPADPDNLRQRFKTAIQRAIK